MSSLVSCSASSLEKLWLCVVVFCLFFTPPVISGPHAGTSHNPFLTAPGSKRVRMFCPSVSILILGLPGERTAKRDSASGVCVYPHGWWEVCLQPATHPHPPSTITPLNSVANMIMRPDAEFAPTYILAPKTKTWGRGNI